MTAYFHCCLDRGTFHAPRPISFVRKDGFRSMKKISRFRKLPAWFLMAALIAWALAIPALASVPSRPSNQYVLDSAGVLSDSTEQEIVSKNKALFTSSGAEIVIVAVDFLGGETIDDYAYDLFNSWGIGSKERNNGLLLVMAVAEDNYYALPGYGVEDHFTGGMLQDLLDESVEPAFAQKDYDTAAGDFFAAALAEMNSISYQDEYSQQNGFQQGGAYENYGGYGYADSFSIGDALGIIFSLAIRVIAVVVVVVLVLAIFRMLSGGGRGGPGSGSGGGGGFWTGMLLGNLLGGSRRRRWYSPPPPPPGGFGGPRPPRGGGFGGFGGSGGFHSGGGSRGGGFHGGGGSRGGGAGRR